MEGNQIENQALAHEDIPVGERGSIPIQLRKRSSLLKPARCSIREPAHRDSLGDTPQKRKISFVQGSIKLDSEKKDEKKNSKNYSDSKTCFSSFVKIKLT